MDDSKLQIELSKLLGVELEWWQLAAFKRALEDTGFLIYHEQGVGKTLTALAIALYRHVHHGVKKVLIVGPLSAIDVWEKELKAHCKIPYRMHSIEKMGKRQKRNISRMPTVRSKVTFVTVNYDSILEKRRVRRGSKTRLVKGKIFAALMRWKPDLIIADEVHNIKSKRTKQTKSLIKLGEVATYKLGCSGTPVEQSALNLWSQYRFACPHVLPDWEEFITKYFRQTGYGYKKLVIRKRREHEILPLIHGHMDRVTKEVLDLPQLKYIHKRFSLTEEAQEIYDQMLHDAVVEIDESNVITSPNVLARMVRLQQIASGYLPEEEGDDYLDIHDRKLRALKQVIKKREGKKVVIFCRFRREIEQAFNLCVDLKMRPVVIHGGVKPPDRKRARRKFLMDPKTLAFIAQVRTGGVGINELVASRYGIFYSTTFSWIDYDQAVCRLHRRGQKKPVQIINIIARKSIEEELYSSLEEKKSTADFVLGVRRHYHGSII